jgi:hypothetical protein
VAATTPHRRWRARCPARAGRVLPTDRRPSTRSSARGVEVAAGVAGGVELRGGRRGRGSCRARLRGGSRRRGLSGGRRAIRSVRCPRERLLVGRRGRRSFDRHPRLRGSRTTRGGRAASAPGCCNSAEAWELGNFAQTRAVGGRCGVPRLRRFPRRRCTERAHPRVRLRCRARDRERRGEHDHQHHDKCRSSGATCASVPRIAPTRHEAPQGIGLPVEDPRH